MAFASIRGITYDVSQQLGRVNAAMGGGQFTQARATAYKGAKGLGDINAAVGAGRRSTGEALTGRVVSRISGSALRAGSTGVPVVDKILRRLISEKAGAITQAWNTRFVDNNRIAGEINPQAINSLEMGKEFVPIIESIGSQILNRIVENAPVESGAFRASFKITGGQATDGRPLVVVFTDDPAWKYIEYGTKKMAARAPIRRIVLGNQPAEIDQFVKRPNEFTNPLGLPWADDRRFLDFAYDGTRWNRAGRGPLRDVGKGSGGTGQYRSPYKAPKPSAPRPRDKYGRFLSKGGTNKGGAHVRKTGAGGKFVKNT
jgi:hypothetical protein